jgi:16S rRNA (guanine1516-N2)-methyltransferase
VTPGDASLDIALAAEEPELAARAARLAHTFNIPLLRSNQLKPRFLLMLCPQGLELQDREAGRQSPLRIDFLSGYYRYRRRRGGGRSQALARAVGLKHGATPTVVDATAGLGKDSFVLAALGCRVVMCERSPAVAALLEDALRRASENPEIRHWVKHRLRLRFGDSLILMPQVAALTPPEVIYLDPMYPWRSKSALVKREIRTVGFLVERKCDARLLLERALELAVSRVVVKRPIKAPRLDGPDPNHAILSTNTRYDVYLT